MTPSAYHSRHSHSRLGHTPFGPIIRAHALILYALLATVPIRTAAADDRVFIPTRAIVLNYDVDNQTDVDCVQVWASTDSGLTWNPIASTPSDLNAVSVTVDQDGQFDFYIVLENSAGASSISPIPGDEPHASLVVDTTPPILQLHRAAVIKAARAITALSSPESAIPPDDAIVALRKPQPPTIELSLNAADENLGPAGVRLFYRPEPGGGRSLWQDGGVLTVTNGLAHWSAPSAELQAVAIRVTATDRAGNQSSEELRAPISLALPTSPVERPRDSMQVSAPPPRSQSELCLGLPDDAIGHETRVAELAPLVAPVAHVAVMLAADEQSYVQIDGEGPKPVRARRLSPEELGRMKTAAAEYLASGQFAGAAARFDNIVEADPADAASLVSLGNALYGLGRHDDAYGRFESALALQASSARRDDKSALPEQARALEGLALVEATRRRYPEARERLQQLLKLQPDSNSAWLHYGDIEHRLGNVNEALTAWRKALDVRDESGAISQQAKKRLKYFEPVATK